MWPCSRESRRCRQAYFFNAGIMSYYEKSVDDAWLRLAHLLGPGAQNGSGLHAGSLIWNHPQGVGFGAVLEYASKTYK